MVSRPVHSLGDRRMTFSRARGLLLVSGLILISLVSLIAISRGVDRIEVIATLLFIPVFAGFLFWGIKGGFWLGLVAALTYVAIRLPSIRLVGLTALSGQLAARILGYLGFGLGGGWAAQQIKATLDKFELHDDIDDETGLGNARSMIEVTDTEKARADRYQKVFSVVLADLSGAQWSDEAKPAAASGAARAGEESQGRNSQFRPCRPRPAEGSPLDRTGPARDRARRRPDRQ